MSLFFYGKDLLGEFHKLQSEIERYGKENAWFFWSQTNDEYYKALCLETLPNRDCKDDALRKMAREYEKSNWLIRGWKIISSFFSSFVSIRKKIQLYYYNRLVNALKECKGKKFSEEVIKKHKKIFSKFLDYTGESNKLGKAVKEMRFFLKSEEIRMGLQHDWIGVFDFCLSKLKNSQEEYRDQKRSIFFKQTYGEYYDSLQQKDIEERIKQYEESTWIGKFWKRHVADRPIIGIRFLYYVNKVVDGLGNAHLVINHKELKKKEENWMSMVRGATNHLVNYVLGENLDYITIGFHYFNQSFLSSLLGFLKHDENTEMLIDRLDVEEEESLVDRMDRVLYNSAPENRTRLAQGMFNDRSHREKSNESKSPTYSPTMSQSS